MYERIDDASEDETLYDLWVDEGLVHPRVNGVWDRTTAKAWIKNWTEANYDTSEMAMVPGKTLLHKKKYSYSVPWPDPKTFLLSTSDSPEIFVIAHFVWVPNRI